MNYPAPSGGELDPKRFISSFAINSVEYAANEWVYGNVEVVDDYGSYGGATFQILITLSNNTRGRGVEFFFRNHTFCPSPGRCGIWINRDYGG